MKYAYYPGCSLNSTGMEYNMSTKAVAKHLGIELWEIPDWNCCGSSPAHTKDDLLALALPARNLAIAEQEGLDIAVPCAACYSRMMATLHEVRESEESKNTIEDVIEMKYEGKNEVKALPDVLINEVGAEEIKNKVVRPLADLKVASYYGCLLVRPIKFGYDDPEDPQSMERLTEALGATPVDWAYKVECCGATHATGNPKIGLKLIADVLNDAKDNGAECIITACPLCFINLDMHQSDVSLRSGGKVNLPVFYFTELMGLAMGYSPQELGINKHFIDPMPLLNKKDILRHPSTRREEA